MEKISKKTYETLIEAERLGATPSHSLKSEMKKIKRMGEDRYFNE